MRGKSDQSYLVTFPTYYYYLVIASLKSDHTLCLQEIELASKRSSQLGFTDYPTANSQVTDSLTISYPVSD